MLSLTSIALPEGTLLELADVDSVDEDVADTMEGVRLFMLVEDDDDSDMEDKLPTSADAAEGDAAEDVAIVSSVALIGFSNGPSHGF